MSVMERHDQSLGIYAVPHPMEETTGPSGEFGVHLKDVPDPSDCVLTQGTKVPQAIIYRSDRATVLWVTDLCK